LIFFSLALNFAVFILLVLCLYLVLPVKGVSLKNFHLHACYTRAYIL